MHNSKIYKTLKPIVNDNTKLCRKKSINKKSIEEVKIKFIPEEKKDFKNFVEKNISTELKCSICKLLFIKPLSCNKCFTPFCEECIKREINLHSRCPKCFQIIFVELLKPPEIKQLENYDKLFKCPYKDCHEEILMKDLKSHMDICLFINKKEDYCDKLIYKDNSTDHNMQKHIIDYMRSLKISQKVGKEIDLNNKLSEDVMEMIRKNNEMKENMRNYNDYAKYMLVDLNELTKKTNARIKIKK